MAQWRHRWITPKAGSRNIPSRGTGIFAVASIQKGEAVGVLGGVVIAVADMKDYWTEVGHGVGLQVSDEFYMCPPSRKEADELGMFNHSCAPNVGFISDIQIVAIKNISEGDELCLDYAFYSTALKEFNCTCNTQDCRKIVSPDDWKLSRLIKEYGAFYSPYLKKKVASLSIERKSCEG